MVQRQCDRCGKYIPDFIDENKLCVSSRGGDDYDLCRKCDEELYEQLMTMRRKAAADMAWKEEQDEAR